jgi:hypothetical protein
MKRDLIILSSGAAIAVCAIVVVPKFLHRNSASEAYNQNIRELEKGLQLLGATEVRKGHWTTGAANSTNSAEKVDLRALVSALHNQDIHWDGMIGGLLAEVEGDAAKSIMARDDPAAIPLLMRALTDEDKFVAAHVLLSTLTRIRGKVNASTWDGLHVTLNANGTTEFRTSDMPELLQQWQARLARQTD